MTRSTSEATAVDLAAATEDNRVLQRDVSGLRDQVSAQEDHFCDLHEESVKASELIDAQKLEVEEAQLALEDAKKKHADLFARLQYEKDIVKKNCKSNKTVFLEKKVSLKEQYNSKYLNIMSMF